MNRFWRVASGLAVFLVTLFFGTSLVLNLFLGERPLPGFVNRVVLPIAACIFIFFSLVGSYLLLHEARKSK
jgi:hypothetical protein